MWRRCAYLSGVLLIAVALAAVPSVPVVESYVGGSAMHGYVADGRYFVEPGHGRPVAEVSEAVWRTVYWLELLSPWSALFPAWAGIFLVGYGKGPNGKPPPPQELPPRVIWACGVSGAFTAVAACLFWVVIRVPWATMLVTWLVGCACCAAVAWRYSRSSRRQLAGEPGDLPDPARRSASGDAPPT